MLDKGHVSRPEGLKKFITNTPHEMNQTILSFDMSEEKFRSIPTPR